MPAHRYWKVILRPVAGSALSVSEIGLYSSGVRRDTPGSVSTLVAPTSGALADLSDGLTTGTVSWSASAAASPGAGLVFDLGSAFAVDEIRIGASTQTTEFPWALEVQGSDDAEAWGDTFVVPELLWPGVQSIAPVLADFYTPDVVFRLTGEGTVGSQVIVSSGTPTRAVVVVGNTSISATAVRGSGSITFDAVGDYLQGTLPELGAFDFTLQCWILPARTNEDWFFGLRDSNNTYAPLILGTGLGKVRFSGSLVVGQWQFNPTFAYGTELAPVGVWSHVALVRDGTTMRLYVNGVQSYTAAAVGSFSLASYLRFGLGASAHNGDNAWMGNIDDFEFILGRCLYPAGTSFTPPAELRSASGFSTSPTFVARAQFPAPRVLHSEWESPAWGVSTPGVVQARNRQDYYGWGRIVGTVKEKDTPDNAPLRRHVYCLDELSLIPVADTWSDATTGVYTFVDLDMTRKYTVISRDHEGVYRSVIANGLTPELMP